MVGGCFGTSGVPSAGKTYVILLLSLEFLCGQSFTRLLRAVLFRSISSDT